MYFHLNINYLKHFVFYFISDLFFFWTNYTFCYVLLLPLIECCYLPFCTPSFFYLVFLAHGFNFFMESTDSIVRIFICSIATSFSFCNLSA